MYDNNREKDILITGEGPTDGLYDETIATEAKYFIDFTKTGRRFVLSLHHNGGRSFLFVNTVKMY